MSILRSIRTSSLYDSLVANRVRELREQRGLTRPAFARLVGMSLTAVVQWETDQRNPTKASARRIARALGIRVDQVVTNDPNPAPRPQLVAAIIPHPDGRPELLMTGRRYGEEQTWSWPSGHIEPEETPEEAVMRELGEELVLAEPRLVRSLGVVDTRLDVSRWWGRHYKRGYVQHCFQVEVASPTVAVIDHEELVVAEWRSLDDLAGTFSKLPAELAEAALDCGRRATGAAIRGNL